MKSESDLRLKNEMYFRFPIFKDSGERHKRPFTTYVGHYFGGENLIIYQTLPSEKPKYRGKKAWDIFYQETVVADLCIELQMTYPEPPTRDEISYMRDSFFEGYHERDTAEGGKLLTISF